MEGDGKIVDTEEMNKFYGNKDEEEGNENEEEGNEEEEEGEEEENDNQVVEYENEEEGAENIEDNDNEQIEDEDNLENNLENIENAENNLETENVDDKKVEENNEKEKIVNPFEPSTGKRNRIMTEGDEDIGDENEPVNNKNNDKENNQPNSNPMPVRKNQEESFFNPGEEMSQFNVELRNDHEFINMSHFDEASKIGFPLNYGENADVNIPNSANRYKDYPITPNTVNLVFQPELEKMNLDQQDGFSPDRIVKMIKKGDNVPTIKLVDMPRDDEERDIIKPKPGNFNTNMSVGKRESFSNITPIVSKRVSDNNVMQNNFTHQSQSQSQHQNNQSSNQNNKSNSLSNASPKLNKPPSILNNLERSSNKNVVLASNNNIYKYEPKEIKILKNYSDVEMLSKFTQAGNSQTFKKFVNKFNIDVNSVIGGGINIGKNNKFTKNSPLLITTQKSPLNSISYTPQISNKVGTNNNYNSNNLKMSLNVMPQTGGGLKKDVSHSNLNNNRSTDISTNNNNNNTNLIQSLHEEIRRKNKLLESSEQDKSKELFKLSEENKELNKQLFKTKYENEVLDNSFKDITFELRKLQSDQIEKDKQIKQLQSDSTLKEEMLNKYIEENFTLAKECEALKSEILNLKYDNTKKTEKLTDLQNRNFELENDFQEFKSRTGSELNNLRDTKMNSDSLKSNYYEIKNQYELLNMKYQTISDESFNLKRDLFLYEKEIKNKNELIEKLRTDLIETSKRGMTNDGTSGGLNLNLNLNNILKGSDHYDKYDNYQNNYRYNSENTNYHNHTLKLEQEKTRDKEREYERNLQELNSIEIKQPLSKKGTVKEIEPASKNNILPSQRVNLEKESRVKVVENQMYALNRERDKLNGELNKLPAHPKKKDQITKKIELEEQIDTYNRDLGKLKQELKELNAINREY